MKAEEEVARQRLSVLQLAEALGNISEACRRRGILRVSKALSDARSGGAERIP